MALSPFFPGLYLGVGCNTVTEKIHGEALDFVTPQAAISAASGQTSELSIQIIESSYQLAEALSISGSASYSSFAFGGSAEASFVSSQEINQYGLCALVTVKVRNGEVLIRNPQLKSAVKQYLEERGWDDFEKTFGSEYLRGFISGGNYFALIHIETESVSERQEIATQLSASGWGVELNAAVEHSLKEMLSDKKTSIFVYQSGGTGDPLEVTLEEMIAQARSFPQLILNEGVAAMGLFSKYSDSVILPSGVEPTPLDRDHQIYALQELNRKYLAYKDLRSDVDFILQNQMRFEAYQDLSDAEWRSIEASLKKDFEGVTEQMEIMRNQARLCMDSAFKCELPTEYYQIVTELPTIEEQNMAIREIEAKFDALQAQLNKITECLEVRPGVDHDMDSSDNVYATLGGHEKNYANFSIISKESPTIQLQNIKNGRDAQSSFGALSISDSKDELRMNYRGQKSPWGSSIALKSDSIDLRGKVIDLDGKVTVDGKSPFQMKKCRLAGGSSYNTGYSTEDWQAVIAGFSALDGDINENDDGNIINVYPYTKDGKWNIYANFRTHKDNETWDVWVLFISKNLM